MENHREKLEKSIQEFKSLLKEDFKFHSEDQSTGVKIEISSKQINGLFFFILIFKIFQIL